jgi:iron complex outermembrane receptor protein
MRTSLLIRMKLETWDQNVNFNNGKRKNLVLVIHKRPWRGETGSDISGIPIDAIKDIQVLRDGASQYGSDAIAGVINIILKDSPKGGSATVRTG